MRENSLEIIVVGGRKTISFFSLLGAKGIYGGDPYFMVIEYIEENVKSIGGILFEAEYYDPSSQLIKKINRLGIPVITLPSPSGNSDAGYKTLMDLSEKAIGIRLPIDI